jgi:hypothetical protein
METVVILKELLAPIDELASLALQLMLAASCALVCFSNKRSNELRLQRLQVHQFQIW